MIRLMDIVLSSLALLILSPLLILIMLVLRLTGEGYIFYCQERLCKNGKKFKLIKFATMLKDSPSMGTKTLTTKNDVRILPFGKILRKTKMNEIPQLLNVIKGDMSLIGPRPFVEHDYSGLSEQLRNELLNIKPGLSGIASIFFRDQENKLHGRDDIVNYHTHTLMPIKAKIEVAFHKKNSLWQYFKAILVTVWVVLFPKSEIYRKVFRGVSFPEQVYGD